jgi:hypothetical protein
MSLFLLSAGMGAAPFFAAAFVRFAAARFRMIAAMFDGDSGIALG